MFYVFHNQYEVFPVSFPFAWELLTICHLVSSHPSAWLFWQFFSSCAPLQAVFCSFNYSQMDTLQFLYRTNWKAPWKHLPCKIQSKRRFCEYCL